MTSANNNTEIFSKYMEKSIRHICVHGVVSNPDKLYELATQNRESYDEWLHSIGNNIDTVEKYIQIMSVDFINYCWSNFKRSCSYSDKGKNYREYCRDEIKFWAQSAYKLSIIHPKVSKKTRKIIYQLSPEKGYISDEQKLNILFSLVNDEDEWAESALSSKYIISTFYEDGSFPSSKTEFGLSLTKMHIQKMIKRYNNEYLSDIDLEKAEFTLGGTFDPFFGVSENDIHKFMKGNLEYTFSSSSIRPTITYDIVTLCGFGHISLKKNVDDVLGLQSLILASKIIKKFNGMNSDDVEIFWNSKLSKICQISNNELAELYYRVGSKNEIFVENIDDYKQIIDNYKSAADLGHSKSMFSLAVAYYSGLNIVSKNEKNAKYWLNKAIENDVIEAVQFLNEHPELKEGIKNIIYHADGDIIQENRGIIAKDDAIVNRSIVEPGHDISKDFLNYNETNIISKKENQESTFFNDGFKFCIKCGTKLQKNAKFCSNCGEKCD